MTAKRDKIKETDLQGFKYFKPLKDHYYKRKKFVCMSNQGQCQLELTAETIATIYKNRWTIEIFFRFYKHILGCRHLISHSKNGIEIQCYMAIIACMLISLWTGRKPTLRAYEMVCWYFTGMADEEGLLNHVARLKKHY
jgi:transposase